MWIVRQRRLFILLLSLLVAVPASAQPAAGQTLRNRLQGLAESTTGGLSAVDQSALTECPQGIENSGAARVVAQIIQHTFYRWKEYDIVDDDGQTRLCLVLVRPSLGPLSKEDAQVLLSASQMWTEAVADARDMIILSPSDPSLNVPPVPVSAAGQSEASGSATDVGISVKLDASEQTETAGQSSENSSSVSPESVIGSDDRERVADTQSYPWNTVCYVTFTSGLSSYRGSAFLVSPYAVLTAAHNVYDQDTSAWSSQFLISPGQYQLAAGGEVYRPYGQRYAAYLSTNTAYAQGGGFEYDYAAALFETPFGSISTFMPVEFDYTPGSVEVTGYPAEVQGETNSYAMWTSSGSVSAVSGTNDRILEYTVDSTGGNSGGPVWAYSGSTGLRRVVAVHDFGATTYNGGARMVAQNESLITQWMQWTPTPEGWQNVPGTLEQLTAGDLDADGKADLAGVTSSGQIFYSLDLENWQWLAGTLTQLASGDLNGDGAADLVGLTAAGQIFYSLDHTNWQWMPGILAQLAAGDLNGDGNDDLVGLTSDGSIYYTLDLATWSWMPGVLGQLCTGDLNADGKADLIGVTSSGLIFYTTDLSNWTWIAGTLSQLTAGDLNGDGAADIAGVTASGQIFYTTDLGTWQNDSSQSLQQLTAGDLNGDGKDDLAGVDASGQIYYRLDLVNGA